MHVMFVEERNHCFLNWRFELAEQFSFERIGDEPDASHRLVPPQVSNERLQRLPGHAGNGVLADVPRHAVSVSRAVHGRNRFVTIAPMKNFFVGFLLGVILTAFTGWYFIVARKQPGLRHAQQSTANALGRAVNALETRLVAWHLTSDDIREELNKTGRVVRRSVRDFGAAMADVGADAAITAKIKSKYALDRDLSALKISVSTTDGRVTLAGTVGSHQLIGKAILLAMETEGVREVSSTLQVKK
jgi:hyperosmotically inducible protein